MFLLFPTIETKNKSKPKVAQLSAYSLRNLLLCIVVTTHARHWKFNLKATIDMYGGQERGSVYRSVTEFPYCGAQIGQYNLQASCKNSLNFVQRLGLQRLFDVHKGCVNTINWNRSGTHFISGSDDNHIVISELKTGRIALKCKTPHKRRIFSARFMPNTNDQAVVSCSGDGSVIHTEFVTSYGPGIRTTEVTIGDSDMITNTFDCHAFGTTFDVLPMPDSPRTFLSCSEDGTVRCYDLRLSNSCSNRTCKEHIYIKASCSVSAMDIAPINNYQLAIGCADSIVRLYDRRKLSEMTVDGRVITSSLKAYPIPLKRTNRHYRPTCIKFSSDETDLLVSYNKELIYLYDLKHEGFDDATLLLGGCYPPTLHYEKDNLPPMSRLRFRGDWSDTGPESQIMFDQLENNRPDIGQARPALEPGVLNRLSEDIFRMLVSQGYQSRQASTTTTSSQGAATATTATAATNDEPCSSSTTTSDNSNDDGSSNESTTATTTSTTSTANTKENEKDDKSKEIDDFTYVRKWFRGHRNLRTVIKGACFWGHDYIMSGSDCGNIFVWNRHTGKVVNVILADKHVVNRVQPHPIFPFLLTSGIEYNIKLFAPMPVEPNYDETAAMDLMRSNALITTQTRDTIAVPAQMMVRILASFHQNRRTNLGRNRAGAQPSSTTSATNTTTTTATTTAASSSSTTNNNANGNANGSDSNGGNDSNNEEEEGNLSYSNQRN